MLRGAVSIVTVNLIKLLSLYGRRLLQPMIRVCFCGLHNGMRQSVYKQEIQTVSWQPSITVHGQSPTESLSALNGFCWVRSVHVVAVINKVHRNASVDIFSIRTSSNGIWGRWLQILLFSKKEALFRFNEASSRRHLHGNMQIKLGKGTRNTTRRSRHDFLALLGVKPWWELWSVFMIFLFCFCHFMIETSTSFSAQNMLVMNGLLKTQGFLEF